MVYLVILVLIWWPELHLCCSCEQVYAALMAQENIIKLFIIDFSFKKKSVHIFIVFKMWLNGNGCPQHVSGIYTVQEETDTAISEAQHNSVWSLELILPSSKGFFSPFLFTLLFSSSRLEIRRAVRELEIRAQEREEIKVKPNPFSSGSLSAAVYQQQPLMQVMMGNVPGAVDWGIERGVCWPTQVESAFTTSIMETLTPIVVALHHIAPCSSSPSSLPFSLTPKPHQFLSFVLCWNDLPWWINSIFLEAIK